MAEGTGLLSPKTGLSKQEMHSRNAQFMDETGCSQEIALEMLIGASWDVDIAMDEFREQQKEQQYKTDKTGLGGLSTSIWSWGAKAAAAATELSKDVAAKVDTGGITKGMDSFSSYVDSVFPTDDKSAALKDDLATALVREEQFHDRFPGLDQGENIIESFACSLLQKYRCHFNNLTPEIPVAFAGHLYITKHNTCFFLDATLHQERHEIPLAMSFSEVVAINKAKKGDDLIRIVVDEVVDDEDAEEDDGTTRSQYIFTDFSDSEAFESALGILEQMWEDEQSEDREQEEEQTGGRGELVQHMADGGHEPERST